MDLEEGFVSTFGLDQVVAFICLLLFINKEAHLLFPKHDVILGMLSYHDIYDDITYIYVCNLNYNIFPCFYNWFASLHILEEAEGLDLTSLIQNFVNSNVWHAFMNVLYYFHIPLCWSFQS